MYVPNNLVSVSNSNTHHDPSSLQSSTSLIHKPSEACQFTQMNQRDHRPLHPYTGAKSDGQLLNKHAAVSLGIIAAADRKKRKSVCQQEVPDSS